MNEKKNLKAATRLARQKKSPPDITLKAAYAILAKAYFRNHPDGIKLTREGENHE